MEYTLPSMFGVEGRVVAVTGGAGGIGGGLCEALAALGAKVAIIDVNEEKMEKQIALIKEQSPDAEVRGYKTNITEDASVKATFEQITADFGELWGLVNCAGITHVTFLTEMDIERWQAVMNVNLRGSVLCAKYAGIEMMKTGKGGRVINISSLASTHGKPGYTAYTPSKSAIDGFTFTLAAEWGLKGITVNAIAPVLVITDINRDVWEKNPEGVQRFKENNPMGRMCSPELLSGLMVFLLSDSANYVSGQVIGCDGGSTRGDVAGIKPQGFEEFFGHKPF